MQHLLAAYADLLVAEGSAKPGRVAIAGLNDTIYRFGPSDLADTAEELIRQLQVAAIVVAEPTLPYAELLVRRAPQGIACITPRDSESCSFLHDIPLVASLPHSQRIEAITTALTRRKGCIVSSLGMVAQGALTVEQAYIAWSSLYHATTIKYFEDVLAQGFRLADEAEQIRDILRRHYSAAPATPPELAIGPFRDDSQIRAAMAATGRMTVRYRLVDSFFGNISYRGDQALFISQTAARLDQLDRQIDRIPFDNSSTAGITASSELPAHRAILQATGCRAILHGHPRFPVALGFFAEPSRHEAIEMICGIPVVGGEGGQGGLAETVPRAFALTGAPAVIVRGHGVFSIAQDDYRAAFAAMLEVEERCRIDCMQRLGCSV